jgi:flavodoxin
MEIRRKFLKQGLVLGAAFCLPLPIPCNSRAEYADFKTHNPERALVLWCSQTGQTRRYARLLAKGLAVEARDLHEFDKKLLQNYDPIVAGTPVFYYDMTSNIVEWMESLPPIKGTPVAAFVSYGDLEGNRHNASNHLLELLAKKGEFWSVGMHSKILPHIRSHGTAPARPPGNTF